MSSVAQAYDAAAAAWRVGPERVYAPLADALLDACGVRVDGARVLDAGAGTGVAGRAAFDRGARSVVALDLAPRMLAGAGSVPVAGDLARPPFRAGAFDVAVAAFSLTHVPVASDALVALRRVAGVVVASAFADAPDHPAKAAVDDVLGRRGIRAPWWYADFKRVSADLAVDGALAGAAHAAGFGDVRVTRVDVATGVSGAALAAWRLGMAHVAPAVAALPPAEQEEVRRDAARAVAGMEPLVVAMLVLTAR